MQTVTQSETYQNEIGGLDQRISTAESKLTPEAMETTIENSEALSEVRQTADKINWIVESGTSSSNMTLTDDALNVISEGITLTADKINLVANDINLSGNSSVSTIVSNAVDPLETDIDGLTARMTQAETSITQNTEAIELRATKEEVQTAQDTADFATPLTGAEPPEEAPAAGKLWIDDGQTPSVWRRWRGADVPTDREYDETISGNVDSPAFVSIDNTHGQLQTVALEAGCVAQQAGTGDPSPTNIRAISGRESVEVTACGKNLCSSPVTHGTRSASDGTFYSHAGASTNRTSNAEIIPVTGGETYTLAWSGDDSNPAHLEMFLFYENETFLFYTKQSAPTVTIPANANGLGINFLSQNAYATDYIIDVQLELGSTATSYEPYTPMGGGTVTPSEPLYGLPGAEDTVEVDASGDVTVTRRTAVLELDGTEDWRGYGVANGYVMYVSVPAIKQISSAGKRANMVCSHYPTVALSELYESLNAIGQSSNSVNISCADSRFQSVSAWKAYLAAQAAAGTPVTIVYELAAPETEALTAISPIAPQPGQLNLATDADALTATVRGSGWEIINDTGGLSADIQEAQDDISGMVGSINTIENNISAMASQILTPDQIISTVVESTDFQTVSTQVIQTGEGLAIVQTTVDDLGDRVDVIEGAVVIEGANIDIGRSDSNTRLHLDNEG